MRKLTFILLWAMKLAAGIVAIFMLLFSCVCVVSMTPHFFRRLKFALGFEQLDDLPRFIIKETKIICRSIGVDYAFPTPPLGATIEVLHCGRHQGDSFNGSLLMSWDSGNDWISKYKEKFICDLSFQMSRDENKNNPDRFYAVSSPYKNMGVEVWQNNITSLVVHVSYWYDGE